MESKSRVILYAELREKISKMDTYPFSEAQKKATPSSTAPEEEKMKENIDKMLSEKKAYQARQEEKSRREKYASHRQKENGLQKWHIVALTALGILLVVTLFVVLFATGVL